MLNKFKWNSLYLPCLEVSILNTLRTLIITLTTTRHTRQDKLRSTCFMCDILYMVFILMLHVWYLRKYSKFHENLPFRNNKNGRRLLQDFHSTIFSFPFSEIQNHIFSPNMKITLNSHINGSTTAQKFLNGRWDDEMLQNHQLLPRTLPSL